MTRKNSDPVEVRDPFIAAAMSETPKSPAVAADKTDMGQRRKQVAYGVFAALFVVVAAGIVLSKRHPDRVDPVAIQATEKAPAEAQADANPSAPVPAIPAAEPVERAAPAAAAPAPAPEPAAPVAPPPPAIAKPMARVALAVTPWGEVYVDGRKSGISPPLTELKLAPGKHTIEIRNTTFQPYAQSVNLEANATLKIRHKFQ